MSGHVGEGKWNSLALTTQLLPETAKPRARESPLLSCDSPMGEVMDGCREGEHVNEHLASPATGCYQVAHFLSHQQSTESSEARLECRENDGERADKTPQRAQRKQILLICHRFPSNTCSQGLGDNLPQMSPSGPQTPPACPMPHASPTHAPPHCQLPCMLITCWSTLVRVSFGRFNR